jgi:hypothetical protein
MTSVEAGGFIRLETGHGKPVLTIKEWSGSAAHRIKQFYFFTSPSHLISGLKFCL